MPGVIDRQIESPHTSAAEAAAPDVGKQTPARCREVDDLLSVAVALYERTKDGVVGSRLGFRRLGRPGPLVRSPIPKAPRSVRTNRARAR